MSSRVASIAGLILFAGSLAGVAVIAAPSVPTDVMQPGTQPNQVSPYTSPDVGTRNCKSCHGDTANPDLEPYFGWKGSMMAHASRDPLFWAQLAIAEQDFLPDADPNLRGGVGDMCLRCHMPQGWLQGRSEPTDGSAMDAATDANGVECMHCHLTVNPDQPVNIPGTIEEQNAPFLAYDSTTGEGYSGTGMYVINAEGSRLGPYNDITVAPPWHTWKQSNFHRESEMCATCHDVSNPAVGDLAHNNGAMVPLDPLKFNGTPNGTMTEKAAFNNPPHAYGIVERTFSEWKASELGATRVNDFNTLPAELQTPGGALEVAHSRSWQGTNADYADGTPRYFTCQTCHMAASTGVGSNRPGTPTRTDLPRHDLTGSGYYVPDLVMYQDAEGTLRFGSGLDPVNDIPALNAGKIRAEDMLESAAKLEAVPTGGDLAVRVINLTAHKLISGYPEGRRMWLNIKWFDMTDTQIDENGAYGQIGRAVTDNDAVAWQVESIIDPTDTVVFEAGPGIDQQWAGQLLGFGYDPGFVLDYDRMTDAVTETLGSLAAKPAGSVKKSFHFVLNNVLAKDNRIPPYGLDRDMALERGALPVPATQYGNPDAGGGDYTYWNTSSFPVPAGAVRAEVRLYYQQTSWEYVQFLWLNNDGLNASLGEEGDNLLDAWLNTGMGAPHTMAMLDVDLSTAAGTPGEASLPALPADEMRASYNSGTGLVDVQYTAACDATDHSIYYGPLDSVATYSYSGAACNVGTDGDASFNPGTGSFFFLAVGNNRLVEGSYGRNSSGIERSEETAALGCELIQDISQTCD